ncbi:hypothetical protein FE810_10280 [Thalassotalea litorea]|uniref:DUF2057 domain-containing protein n=1 Tax=Thalassotalea litorea TaxID=2020715 RepID=A0A5R9IL92_9GAMM|nr:hypothetical protein [Thalassotalea litorea]TLU64837.1 hypothetical protein FE810_10280 [Thalassotalea litorea]
MKRTQNAISLTLASMLTVFVTTSVFAVEDSKVHFTKDMQVSITTVAGNHFTAYDALINKPLAQLIEVPSYRLVSHQQSKPNSFFETAMKAQDRVQYFFALVGETFSQHSHDEDSEQCQPSKLARLFSF